MTTQISWRAAVGPRWPRRSHGDVSRYIHIIAIRHGEAEHNIREKEASWAVEKAMLASGSQTTEIVEAKESARKSALLDASLLDAPLSSGGKAAAHAAADAVASLVQNGAALQPTLVLSSPLQRALQTTAGASPRHGSSDAPNTA